MTLARICRQRYLERCGSDGEPSGQTPPVSSNRVSRAGVFRYSPLANIADINPSISKMIVLDRDLSGVVVSTHNNEGFSGWNPPIRMDSGALLDRRHPLQSTHPRTSRRLFQKSGSQRRMALLTATM